MTMIDTIGSIDGLSKGATISFATFFHLLSYLKFTISHNAISIGIVWILRLESVTVKIIFTLYLLVWTYKIFRSISVPISDIVLEINAIMFVNIIIIWFIKLEFVYFVFFYLYLLSMFRVCMSYECRQMSWKKINFIAFRAMNDDYANYILLHLRIRYVFFFCMFFLFLLFSQWFCVYHIVILIYVNKFISIGFFFFLFLLDLCKVSFVSFNWIVMVIFFIYDMT